MRYQLQVTVEVEADTPHDAVDAAVTVMRAAQTHDLMVVNVYAPGSAY